MVNNAVLGVTKGHEKNLELNGVGFRASLKGDKLVLQLGFSHEVTYSIPKGIVHVVFQGTWFAAKDTVPLASITFLVFLGHHQVLGA